MVSRKLALEHGEFTSLLVSEQPGRLPTAQIRQARFGSIELIGAHHVLSRGARRLRSAMGRQLALERRHLPPLFLCELARRRTSLEIGQSRLCNIHFVGAHDTFGLCCVMYLELALERRHLPPLLVRKEAGRLPSAQLGQLRLCCVELRRAQQLRGRAQSTRAPYLMREAISMMREAIILMREAIGWGRLHLHPRVE